MIASKSLVASFLGGDLNTGKEWNLYCLLIGSAVSQPLQRNGAKAGDMIYLTGPAGRGNLQAGMNLFLDKIPPFIQSAIPEKWLRFPLRGKASN